MGGGGGSSSGSGGLGALAGLIGGGGNQPNSGSSNPFGSLFGGNTAQPQPNSGSSSGGFFDSIFGGGSKPQQPSNQYGQQYPGGNNYQVPNNQQGATLSGRKFLESFSDCCQRQPGGQLCGRTSFTSSCCTQGHCSGLFIKTCSDKFQINSCNLVWFFIDKINLADLLIFLNELEIKTYWFQFQNQLCWEYMVDSN